MTIKEIAKKLVDLSDKFRKLYFDEGILIGVGPDSLHVSNKFYLDFLEVNKIEKDTLETKGEFIMRSVDINGIKYITLFGPQK